MNDVAVSGDAVMLPCALRRGVLAVGAWELEGGRGVGIVLGFKAQILYAIVDLKTNRAATSEHDASIAR